MRRRLDEQRTGMVLAAGLCLAASCAALGAATKGRHAAASRASTSSRGTASASPVKKLLGPAAIRFRKKHFRLSWYHTRFNSREAKRSHNIRLAVNAINGTLLPPGGIFSLNQTVGERTHAHGYLTAPVFENRKLVPGVGGGVSQVTGTLFNAALLAGLPIVQYHTHAKPVHYIPVGRDATVAWHRFDMKFKNNTGSPILISYRVSGNSLLATLYGAKPPKRKISLVVRSQKKGPHEMTAQLFRFVKRGGKVTRERIGQSHYDWKEEHPD